MRLVNPRRFCLALVMPGIVLETLADTVAYPVHHSPSISVVAAWNGKG
jgi:hypothetical protein